MPNACLVLNFSQLEISYLLSTFLFLLFQTRESEKTHSVHPYRNEESYCQRRIVKIPVFDPTAAGDLEALTLCADPRFRNRARQKPGRSTAIDSSLARVGETMRPRTIMVKRTRGVSARFERIGREMPKIVHIG